MSIVLIVILDIVLFAITSLFTQGIWNIVRYFTFCIPFTDQLYSLNVIEKDMRAQILIVDAFSPIFTFVLGNIVCLVLAMLARPSGFIVYFAAIAITLLFFRPARDRYTWSSYTVGNYIQKHSICMDVELLKKLSSSPSL